MKQNLIETVKLAFWDEWPCSCETQTYCRALSPHEVDEATIDACFQAAILAYHQWLANQRLVVVPREITGDMADAMECEFSTEGQWHAALAAAPDILGETKC